MAIDEPANAPKFLAVEDRPLGWYGGSCPADVDSFLWWFRWRFKTWSELPTMKLYAQHGNEVVSVVQSRADEGLIRAKITSANQLIGNTYCWLANFSDLDSLPSKLEAVDSVEAAKWELTKLARMIDRELATDTPPSDIPASHRVFEDPSGAPLTANLICDVCDWAESTLSRNIADRIKDGRRYVYPWKGLCRYGRESKNAKRNVEELFQYRQS